ncbi:MAG: preprotein translocase subunit Sec61beta [Nanoarchaeota archaeon]|nr:preprotein translocase subunit Sec61beta [Nanoarchaeota archaeon]
MAKQSGISLPSGQGGLIGGVSTTYKTRFEFGPKVVVFFAILTVIIILVLHNSGI